MGVAVAIDPAIFRPDLPTGKAALVRTAVRVARPKQFTHGMPVAEQTVIFMAAFDPVARVYTVSRYPKTGDGITFEAGSIDEA